MLQRKRTKGKMCFSFFFFLICFCFLGSPLSIVSFCFPVKSITHTLLFCAGLFQSNRGLMSVLKSDCKPREIGKGTQQQVKWLPPLLLTLCFRSFQLHGVCGQILDQGSSLWLVGSLKSLWCLHFPSNSFKRRLYLCQSIYLTPIQSISRVWLPLFWAI